MIRAAMIAVVLAVVGLLPLTVSHFHAYQLSLVGVFFIAIVGLNVLTGYSGQISLGHGAFMCIGAYTTAILNVNYGVSEYWTIPCAGIVAGVVGFLFGFPALRLAGVYLALATFGLAVSVVQIAKRFDRFTGGTPGKILNQPSSPVHGLSANVWLYYLTWAIAIVLLVAAWLLVRGRTGLSLRALRDSPIAATAFGISLARYKTLAFALSAAYAGVGGALYAIAIAFVNPDTFPVTLSILLLTGAVLGGLGSLWGMVFGAFFIEFAPLYAARVNESAPSVAYGVILLAVLFVLPEGAGGLVERVVRRVSRDGVRRTRGRPSPSSSSSA